MVEYVKKADVLEIMTSPLSRDLAAEYIYDLKGVWLDEDEADTSQTDCPKSCPSRDVCTKDATDCPWK